MCHCQVCPVSGLPCSVTVRDVHSLALCLTVRDVQSLTFCVTVRDVHSLALSHSQGCPVSGPLCSVTVRDVQSLAFCSVSLSGMSTLWHSVSLSVMLILWPSVSLSGVSSLWPSVQCNCQGCPVSGILCHCQGCPVSGSMCHFQGCPLSGSLCSATIRGIKLWFPYGIQGILMLNIPVHNVTIRGVQPILPEISSLGAGTLVLQPCTTFLYTIVYHDYLFPTTVLTYHTSPSYHQCLKFNVHSYLCKMYTKMSLPPTYFKVWVNAQSLGLCGTK